ncbi:MAG: glycosyltransferase family 39 protein [Myxococcaceae bacterium]|nr:glycosyltransferase family 39 protein [Myxococcaceae bacterium]
MWVDWLSLAALTAWGLYWLLPGLDHPAIHNWDESFHHAVTRGTADTPFAPHMLVEPFYPLNLRHWWIAGIWMHKPTGVFWWGALMIKLFGVSTLALRSASLLGELGMAWLTFLFIRPIAGRVLAVFFTGAFLVLPWGWWMTQGHFVADVTDIAVAAFVTLGIAFLWWAVERESAAWALAAGAAIGVGYLCKSFLSLAPLGVAGAWWALARVGLCRGPTFKQVLLMFLGFVVLAAPWNLYAWRTFPDVYVRAFDHTTGFVNASSGEDVGSGARPADAIFNEINWSVFGPLPYPLTLLCGLWLLISALRTRDGREVMMTLWLWSTWLVHSYTNVKGASHMWNMVPAGFFAYAVTLRDAFRYKPLGAAVIASLCVYELQPKWALVASIKQHLPALMAQTRTWERSNLVEQFLVVPLVVVAAVLLSRGSRRWPRAAARLATAFGLIGLFGVFVFAWPRAAAATRERSESLSRADQITVAQDVGLALDGAIEKKSVLFDDSSFDVGTNFDWVNLIFWSGRMVYRQPPDVATAEAKGYHPYVVSCTAESFEPVAAVPTFSPLRAYDLRKPLPEPAPPPTGLSPLGGAHPAYDALGWAGRPLTSRWGRYAFYLAPKGPVSLLQVHYHLKDGKTVSQAVDLQLTRVPPQRLQARPWFIASDIGPPFEDVASIDFSP